MTEEISKVFTEDLLLEISKSKTPFKLVVPVIHETFKYLGNLITEEDSKVTTILCSLFVDTFVYFYYKMSFTMQQCSVLLDILFALLVFSVKISQFDKAQDIEYLSGLSLPYSQGMNPLFSSVLMTQALDHLSLTYFNHYNLYKYIFTQERTQKNIKVLIDIDIPLTIQPHSSATQRIAKIITETPRIPEIETEEEVIQTKESLKERLLRSMDENLREKFLEKIAEARDSMAKQLDNRDKMLKQKWEDLEKELKRKRRRG